MKKPKNLALLAVSVVVSLAVLEALTRLASGTIPIAVMADAPDMAARGEFLEARGLTVGTPTIELQSSRGGRSIRLQRDTIHTPVDPEDVEYGAIARAHRTGGFCNFKPPEEIDASLVAVGDSFTNCSAVEIADSWAHQLSDVLGVETLNLGMLGKGLAQYYEVLRQKAPSTTRIAVIGIYEGNDLRDSLRFETWRSRGAQVTAPTINHKRISRLVRSSFLGESYLLAFVWGSVRTLKRRLLNPEFSYDVEVEGHEVTLNVHDADADELRHARWVRDGKVSRERIAALWDEPIGWIVDLAKERSFVPLFIYLPSAYTAYRDSVRFHDQDNGDAVQQFSRVQREVFAELCRRRGLECLDTVPAFDAASDKRLTHFPSNVHLTPYGHRIVAEAVARYISDSPRLSRVLVQL